jgi:hypothetical protein
MVVVGHGEPGSEAGMVVIHEAGSMFGHVQVCRRCGVILSDYRNAMVPEDSPPLRGWQPGAHIEVTTGNPKSSLVTDDPPTCEETF